MLLVRNWADIEVEEDRFVIYGEKDSFGDIQAKLEALGITPEEANLERIPNTYKQVDEATFEQCMQLIEALEADDDVIKVFHSLLVDQYDLILLNSIL